MYVSWMCIHFQSPSRDLFMHFFSKCLNAFLEKLQQTHAKPILNARQKRIVRFAFIICLKPLKKYILDIFSMTHSGYVFFQATFSHTNTLHILTWPKMLSIKNQSQACQKKKLYNQNIYISTWADNLPCISVPLSIFLCFVSSVSQAPYMCVRFTSGCIPNTTGCVGGCAAVKTPCRSDCVGSECSGIHHVKHYHVCIRKTLSVS